MIFDLNNLTRENIRRLQPYSSARSEFAGNAEVFLDANENAFGSPAGDAYNRYPDPLQTELKVRIAEINDVSVSQIFVGNGSDEAIDLLFRIFCKPAVDEVIICTPTYGMYRVSADINDVKVREVQLSDAFHLDVDEILSSAGVQTKLVFICSPNNPTGNLMRREDVLKVLANFDGIVVVDEAYMHFADEPSMTVELERFPNLVVLQTFSKAWGMAGLRVGTAYASREVISLMNAVKPPYNVSSIAQRVVIDAMDNRLTVNDWIRQTRSERGRLTSALESLAFVQLVYPSDANFVLVKTDDARAVYRYLIEKKIVVRDRSSVELCEGCLRITVGTPVENNRLIEALSKY